MPPALISDFMHTSHISQNQQHSWPSHDRTSSSRTSGSSDFRSTSHIIQNLQHSWPSHDRTSVVVQVADLAWWVHYMSARVYSIALAWKSCCMYKGDVFIESELPLVRLLLVRSREGQLCCRFWLICDVFIKSKIKAATCTTTTCTVARGPAML